MKIVNRKFNRDYESVEEYEAGIALTGAEVKSIREGRIKLEDSYVKLMENGPHLINAEIYKYQYAGDPDYDPKRSRKLLLNKAELTRIRSKIQGGGSLTLVPVSCYNKGVLIKLKIALARGRKDLQKRKLEKAKTIKRAQEKEAKEYIKRG